MATGSWSPPKTPSLLILRGGEGGGGEEEEQNLYYCPCTVIRDEYYEHHLDSHAYV